MGKDAKIMQQVEREWLRHEVSPALNQLLHNDQVSQGKIAALDTAAAESAKTWKYFAGLTLMGRLRWLLRGV